MEYERASIEPLCEAQLNGVVGGVWWFFDLVVVVTQGIAVVWVVVFW